MPRVRMGTEKAGRRRQNIQAFQRMQNAIFGMREFCQRG